MTLLLTNSDVERASDIAAQIDAIEAGLREEANGTVDLPPRLNLATTTGFFRVMPAVMRDSGLMGYKVFHGSVRHGVRYLIAIYDEKDVRLLALMDAAYLTATRTGATTGVATRYMAPPNAATVGVIGSGLEATTNLEAVCAVRPVREGKVFSPTPANRERFAARMSDRLGLRLEAVATPEQAVADVEVVVVATNTTGVDDLSHLPRTLDDRGPARQLHRLDRPATPRGRPGNLRPRRPRRHRFAGATRSRIRRCARRPPSRHVRPSQSYRTQKSRRRLRLGPDRTGADETTLFKSVGTAVQDVAAGFAVYREAVRRGLGRDVGDFLELKTF